MKIERKEGKFRDAVVIYFDLEYSDISLYSLTIIDAYRTPSAKIITEEELESFLKDW
jgi:hypothetical protein